MPKINRLQYIYRSWVTDVGEAYGGVSQAEIQKRINSLCADGYRVHSFTAFQAGRDHEDGFLPRVKVLFERVDP